MPPAYIAGVGQTPFGKVEMELPAMMAQAASRALGDAGAEQVDALIVGSQTADDLAQVSNLGTKVADILGLSGVAAWRVENSSASGSAVLEAAVHAVRSGAYGRVLAVGGERMTDKPTPTVTRVLGRVLADTEVRLGLTMTSLAAMVARMYMVRYGLSRQTLALVPVKAHGNATRNPYAQFQKAVTVQKVLESPVIADPLRMFDCAPISDGAAAVVVQSQKSRVQVLGVGHGTDRVALADRRGDGLRATQLAARAAFAQARIATGDVHVAELHDAFSILEIMDSEDVGFYQRGEGWRALERGDTALGGSRPINTSGGLKARGHPVGATGLAQVAEIVWQLRGEAGARQVDRARVGLTQNIGGFGCNNLVCILGSVA
jgi:acetyl-CoA C-acetyltransferase